MTRRRQLSAAVELPQLFDAEPELVANAAPAAEPEPTTQTVPVVVSQAVRELLEFPARLIAGLPLGTTLRCARSTGEPITVTTSRSAYEASRVAGLPTFSGSELAALALAAEHDRASPAVFERWCATKASDPAWKLSAEAAIGGAVGRFEPLGWPLGQVLRLFGLELRAVGVGDEIPEGGHA